MKPATACRSLTGIKLNTRTVRLTLLRDEAAVPAASLAGTVVLPRRPLVEDQLCERTRIVGVPHRVDDLAGRRKKRSRPREQCVVTLEDPAEPFPRFARANGLPDRLAICEPGKIDATRDRQTHPLPNTWVHIEEQMLLSRGVPDEL